MQGQLDHHSASSMDSSLDTFFWNWIVMVASGLNLFDNLNLWENFGHKILGGVDAIVITVLLNRDGVSVPVSPTWWTTTTLPLDASQNKVPSRYF